MTPVRRFRAAPARSRDGWPLPPPMAPAWMARRARWWLQLLRAGRVHRFQADLRALHGGLVVPRARRALVGYGEALRQEWRARLLAGPAGPALQRADHPNYLGDRAVVGGLVDGYIALLLARAAGNAPHEACEAEIHRLAGIFAGADEQYAPIGGWNTAGQLGHSIIARCPLRETPEAGLPTLLAEMFAFLGLLVLRLLRAAEDGQVSADAVLRRLRALAERAGAILLGTADAEPEEATLAALVEDVPGMEQAA